MEHKVAGTLHVHPMNALRSISIFVVVANVAASVSAICLLSLSLVDSLNVVLDCVSFLVFLTACVASAVRCSCSSC